MPKKQTAQASSQTIVSFIILTHNDEDIIEERLKAVHAKLKQLKSNYEIVVIDNNSTDHTIHIIRKLHTKIPFIRILVLSKEYPTDIALTAGLDNCIGDYSLLFNIYTDPISVVTTLYQKLQDGYDIVIGKPDQDTTKRSFLTRLFLTLIKQISRHDLQLDQNFLIGLNRRAVNSIIRTRRKSRNFAYINNLIGLKKYMLSYKTLKLRYKTKKENFLQTAIAVTDIIISNSFRPIRILTMLGIFCSLFFLLYVFCITILFFFFDTRVAPQGWISIGTVMGTMFFLLFTLLTLLSEYIIRILEETRNEPFYFISDEFDKSIIFPKGKRVNVV